MDLKFIVESILFSAQKPLTAKEIRELFKETAAQSEDEEIQAFKKIPLDKISTALEELAVDHDTARRSYHLMCVAGAWQFVSRPEFAPWLKTLVGHKSRPPRLSQPGLETLAIIAYRQPLTRSEMEQVRGVSVDGVLATLVDRGLVEQVGRAEVPGRPMTYGTTSLFLEYFGLKDLADLPEAEELRRVPVERPESLLTVDPGLATAPPEDLETSESSSERTHEADGGPNDAPASGSVSDAAVEQTASEQNEATGKRPATDPAARHSTL